MGNFKLCIFYRNKKSRRNKHFFRHMKYEKVHQQQTCTMRNFKEIQKMLPVRHWLYMKKNTERDKCVGQ